jgi:3-methyladenine DNA glycosylase AlkC
MEPFKNVFHRRGIALVAAILARHVENFRESDFVQQASHNLESLELKARSQQIYHALCDHLPQDFLQACAVIKNSLHPCCEGAPVRAETDEQGIQGWMILPFAEYAGLRGSEHLLEALKLLRELTMRFSSEFGIRHLFKRAPLEVLAIIVTWTEDPNEHVRRLASEGSRPRLPWGLQLQAFVKDPTLTLPILEKLRDDPSEYVRRSVANHLNDFAKDHPAFVLNIAHEWNAGANSERKKLLRHALRNLLKEGHAEALSLYEMSEPSLGAVRMELAARSIAFPGDLVFCVSFTSTAQVEQKLRLDLVVHYQKANGSMSPKVFLWKQIHLAAGETHVAEKVIRFRPITTRVYHAGRHRVECKVNGKIIEGKDFELFC